MADDWCEVMEMLRVTCAHCRPPAERRRLDAEAEALNRKGGNTAPRRTVDAKTLAWTITKAQIPGRCVLECGAPVEEGDEIIKVQGHGWAHLECTQAS